MNDHRKRITAALTMTAEQYGRDLPSTQLKAMVRLLESKRYSPDAIINALSRHMLDPTFGRWMPTVADIVREIEGIPENNARKAFSKVLEAMRRVGAYASVTFDDARIHNVIEDMGGWTAVGEWPTEEKPLGFIERDFVKRYVAACGRTDELHRRALPGIFERHNRLHHPKHVDDIVLIGDPGHAKDTLATGASTPPLRIETAPKRIAEVARGIAAPALPEPEQRTEIPESLRRRIRDMSRSDEIDEANPDVQQRRAWARRQRARSQTTAKRGQELEQEPN